MISTKWILFLFVIFLLPIQSVFAISNVQHSVDGTKITLTYQGTPPFWINIRGDTNIGQAGGYLWAKTYSNSFSYDMSFAINPSKKFHYGVKDVSWSSTNNFLIGETGFQNCAELIPGFNNIKENRINIVFVGVNFKNLNLFLNATKYYVNLDENVYDNLFFYEPFKSNHNKFNLWYVNKIGEVEKYNTGLEYFADEANTEIDKLASFCNFPHTQEVALINWLFKTSGGNTKAEFVRIKVSHNENTGPQFVHEFGHTFGLLGDEYTYGSVNSPMHTITENCDTATSDSACPKWCTGLPVPVEDVKNYKCYGNDLNECMTENQTHCIWMNNESTIEGYKGCVNRLKMCNSIPTSELCNSAIDSWWSSSVCIWLETGYPSYSYFKSNCIPTSLRVNIGNNCLAETGCYQSCGSSNLFKSPIQSMMSITGAPFGALNERILCKRIKEVTGSVGGVCTTKYGLK